MTEPAEQTGASQKTRDIVFTVKELVGQLGLPVLICGGLLYVMWFILVDFKKDVSWKLERSIRNERSIMQKLGIPVILDSDRSDANGH